MVDWGDDVALSVMLSNVTEETRTALKPTGLDRIRSSVAALHDLHLGKGISLDTLRNSGVHPSTLASNGIRLAPLLKQHGFDALIDYGFSWQDMRDMGLTARQACSMNASQLRNLGVNACMLAELRPTISYIASMRMSPVELHQFGFTSDLLVAMGLHADNMAQFGYSIPDWKRTIGIKNWQALGFVDYSECERMGWSRVDLHRHGVLNDVTPVPVAQRVTPVQSASRRRGQCLEF
tara:strand:- start:613 stop:1320 length:708 start_codon:yes stop_codon:yes gene_type:complete